MWSEHCSYKSSKMHLKRLPTRGKLVVQGRAKMPGVVDIGDGLVAAFKIESHNHPSYVEPFPGRDYRCRRIARYFHDGRSPDRIPTSLPFWRKSTQAKAFFRRGAQESTHSRRSRSRVGHYGNCFGVPYRRPAKSASSLLRTKPAGPMRWLWASLAREDIFLAQAKAPAIP